MVAIGIIYLPTCGSRVVADSGGGAAH